MGDYITKKNLGDAPGREKALAKESTLKEFKKYLPKIDPAEKDPFKKPEYITKKEKKPTYITKKEKPKEWITLKKKEYPKIGKDY
jgi:hypothetical protein|tara:strand:- start:297 stop:551 length:255 start_codon:yes stop_codon:yes gene_type:complete